MSRVVLVLAVALAAKQYYSTASVAELGWILRPTTVAVEAITGRSFDYERDTGFVHRPLAFAICKPCAGLNFAIIAFVMLALSTSLPLAACGAAALASTIVTNAARISLTVARLQWFPNASDPERLHRLEGVAIYFLALCALYVLATRRRTLLVPLACYLAITVVLPLLNGAAPSEHMLMVVLVPLSLVALIRKRERPGCAREHHGMKGPVVHDGDDAERAHHAALPRGRST